MKDGTAEATRALIAFLRGESSVTALVGARIYDRPREDVAFPYLRVTPIQALPKRAACIDGSEVFIQVDVFARDSAAGVAGTITAAKIMAVLSDVLDGGDLPVSNGFALMRSWVEGSRVQRDPDGHTVMGMVDLRVDLAAA
jgi:hypothetical protein